MPRSEDRTDHPEDARTHGGSDEAMGGEGSPETPLEDEANGRVPAEGEANGPEPVDEAPTTPLEQGAPTEVRPFLDVDETAPRPASENDGAARGRAGGILAKLRSLASLRRGTAIAVGLALVALVAVALVTAGVLADASDRPSDELVEQDAARRVSVPVCSPGSYGSDDILVFRDVEVTSCERVDAIEGAPSEGADAFASVTVLATFSGGSVRAEKSVTLGYARVGGSWVAAGSERDGRVAWHATAGVDRQKVLSDMSSLLSRAQSPEDGGTASLEDLYSSGSFEVVEASFDEGAQSDTLVISCARADGFVSYSCELTATFAFRPAGGQWELADATVPEGAAAPSLDAVMGSWSGTFQSQRTEGTRCLAARDAGLEVVVTGYDVAGTTPTITGRVSGLAHYHAHPSSDAAGCDGDLAFADVPFTARLVSSEVGLTFSATLPQDVDGTLGLTLRFGTEERPDAAEAVLETTHPHTKTVLFFPVEETLVYEDTFLLSKS